MNLVERVAAKAAEQLQGAAGGSQDIYDTLKAAEPHFLQFLHEQTKTPWRLKKLEGPTSSGETLITWEGQGTLTLWAMGISEKMADISLYYNDAEGMPNQPRSGRIPIGRLGDAKAVLGNLLAKYKGTTPWTKPKEKKAYEVAARYLAKFADQSKAAPKKVPTAVSP